MNDKNNDSIRSAIMNSGKGTKPQKVTIACPYCGNTSLVDGNGTYGCDDCACVFFAGPLSDRDSKAIAELMSEILPEGVAEDLLDEMPPEIAKHLPRRKGKK